MFKVPSLKLARCLSLVNKKYWLSVSMKLISSYIRNTPMYGGFNLIIKILAISHISCLNIKAAPYFGCGYNITHDLNLVVTLSSYNT